MVSAILNKEALKERILLQIIVMTNEDDSSLESCYSFSILYKF